MKRSRSHPGWWVTGYALTAFWFGVMGMMFWPDRDAANAVELSFSGTELLTPEDEWFGAYSSGQKIGFVHSTSRREGLTIVIHQESKLWFKIGAGQPQLVQSNLELQGGEHGALDSFDFNLRAGPLEIKSHGRVTAQGLSIEFTAAGETFRKTLPLAAKPVFDVALPRLLARQDLRPGIRFQIKLFDPQTLSNQPTVIEVIGRDAINIEGRLVAGIRLHRTQPGVTQPSRMQSETGHEIWIDEDGHLLQEKTSFGLTLRRESEANAVIDIAAEGAPIPRWLPPTLPQSITKDAE